MKYFYKRMLSLLLVLTIVMGAITVNEVQAVTGGSQDTDEVFISGSESDPYDVNYPEYLWDRSYITAVYKEEIRYETVQETYTVIEPVTHVRQEEQLISKATYKRVQDYYVPTKYRYRTVTIKPGYYVNKTIKTPIYGTKTYVVSPAEYREVKDKYIPPVYITKYKPYTYYVYEKVWRYDPKLPNEGRWATMKVAKTRYKAVQRMVRPGYYRYKTIVVKPAKYGRRKVITGYNYSTEKVWVPPVTESQRSVVRSGYWVYKTVIDQPAVYGMVDVEYTVDEPVEKKRTVSRKIIDSVRVDGTGGYLYTRKENLPIEPSSSQIKQMFELKARYETETSPEQRADIAAKAADLRTALNDDSFGASLSLSAFYDAYLDKISVTGYSSETINTAINGCPEGSTVKLVKFDELSNKAVVIFGRGSSSSAKVINLDQIVGYEKTPVETDTFASIYEEFLSLRKEFDNATSETLKGIYEQQASSALRELGLNDSIISKLMYVPYEVLESWLSDGLTLESLLDLYQIWEDSKFTNQYLELIALKEESENASSFREADSKNLACINMVKELGLSDDFARAPAAQMKVWSGDELEEVNSKFVTWRDDVEEKIAAKEATLQGNEGISGQDIKNIVTTILDVVGFFPGVGTFADVLNAGVSLLPEINILEAFFSVVAAIVPFVGNAVGTLFKSVAKLVDKGDNIADLLKQIGNLFEIVDNSAIVTKIKDIADLAVGFMKGIGGKISEAITKSPIYKWLGQPIVNGIDKVVSFFDGYVDDIATKIDDEVGNFCGKIDNSIKGTRKLNIADDVASLAGKSSDEIAQMLDSVDELVLKNGDTIKTADIKAKMLEISDITSEPKTIAEAITDIRTDNIIKNGTGLHSTLSNKATDFKNKIDDILTRSQSRTSGNVGTATIDIDGVSKEMNAFSKFDDVTDIGKGSFTNQQSLDYIESENIVLLKNESDRVFDTSVVKDFDREVDTESKILEEIASQLGNNRDATGTIDLFTTREPCASCRGVMSQFMDRYPNIEINIYHN